MTAGLLTIGEVVKRSGVAASALRFYEDRGLIASEMRAGSGHRRYARSVLRRVAFIVFAQRIGLSLDDIGAELAKLPDGRIPTANDWSRLSKPWVTQIDRRIAELQRLKEGLTRCIGCGCLSLDDIGAELAKLPDGRIPTANDWSRLSKPWVTQIDQRIAELQRLKEGLTRCIGCGCLSLGHCALVNRDDRAAAMGAGPRYWLVGRPSDR